MPSKPLLVFVAGFMALAALSVSMIGLSAQRPVAAEQTDSAKKPDEAPDQTNVAIFASGCFWCTESDFDKVPGVIDTTSGYTGGRTPHPDYESVSTGRTGHVESLRVTYDPSKVTYQHLLSWYWRHVDPVDDGGQFCDRGSQYRPVIFVLNAEQRRLAEESKEQLAKSGVLDRPIAVKIEDAGTFTPAEEYHQDFYKKNPLRYRYYRFGCGRDQRVEQIWSKAPH